MHVRVAWRRVRAKGAPHLTPEALHRRYDALQVIDAILDSADKISETFKVGGTVLQQRRGCISAARSPTYVGAPCC